MKIITYNIGYPQGDGTVILLQKEMDWNEINEEAAKKEAYQGHYSIIDDGKEEPTPQPTQLDLIEAQITYTAMMTDTLLEV